MIEPTCSQRDATSVLFNLSGYRVVEAVDGPRGVRKVWSSRWTLDREGACPSCRVLTARVHQWTLQRGRSRGGGLDPVLTRSTHRSLSDLQVCLSHICPGRSDRF